MKRLPILCAAAVLTLFLTACNQSSNHDADVKAIQANDTQWNQDFASKDVDKLTAHYAPDAVLIVAGGPAISGQDAIRNTIKQMTADPAMNLKFQSSKVDVAASGDLAYTQGSYTLSITDPHTGKVVNDHGSYVTTYRKQADGSWKAVADIVATEVPPPAPAPGV
jgi:uncharacterized protein (TIGR02246 family)